MLLTRDWINFSSWDDCLMNGQIPGLETNAAFLSHNSALLPQTT